MNVFHACARPILFVVHLHVLKQRSLTIGGRIVVGTAGLQFNWTGFDQEGIWCYFLFTETTESKLVKQEANRIVILLQTESVLWLKELRSTLPQCNHYCRTWLKSSLHFPCSLACEQCDQIGLFLKVLGDKFTSKGSLVSWLQFRVTLHQNATFQANLLWLICWQLLDKISYFLFQQL